MANMKLREQAERKYKAMVGQKYNRLTVLEYLGRDETTANGRYLLKCRCDCGDVWSYDARKVLIGKKKSCGQCRERKSRGAQGRKYKPPQTLCWTCKKATDRFQCRWVGGKPRHDWEAILKRRREVIHGKTHITESYRVIHCPDYEEG